MTLIRAANLAIMAIQILILGNLNSNSGSNMKSREGLVLQAAGLDRHKEDLDRKAGLAPPRPGLGLLVLEGRVDLDHLDFVVVLPVLAARKEALVLAAPADARARLNVSAIALH